MGSSFFDPTAVLLMLAMLLGGGIRDLASCLPADAYWKAKGVTVSAEQLARELAPVKSADVSKLIAQLDANDAKDRDAASEQIAAVGAAATKELEETAAGGSPEAASRATALLARIRAASKAASVRRLMAIRSLGEMKKPDAMPLLRPLLDSKDAFEAEYARAAIASIEAKPYALPTATDAERAAEVALLPAKLDAVAQIAPLDGHLTIDKVLAQLPAVDPQHRNQAREQMMTGLMKVLDTVGDFRLDVVTWGFYAAPPGQPGNSVIIVRGEFDPAAVVAALGKMIEKSKNVGGVDVFEMSDDAAILVAPDHRVAFLTREPTGDLSVEATVTALTKGAGDLNANADLTKLMTAVDRKSPLWAVARLSPGLKEILGPLGEFDTASLTGTQKLDEKQKLLTDFQLDASGADAAKAKAIVESVQQHLRDEADQDRKRLQQMPMNKWYVDLLESVKLSADGGKVRVTGSLRDLPIAGITHAEATPVPAPGQ